MTAVDDALANLTDAELAEAVVHAAGFTHPATWLTRVLPAYVGASGSETPDEAEQLFAPHHLAFWDWCWQLEPGERPAASVNVWPRGGAKSTSAEMAAVALGCRGRRRYGLYVCATQSQADDHVGNVGAMLESPTVARWYPLMSERLVGKFGSSKGWRRNRIRTASGFTLDAIGLDTAARGVKLDDQRPDFLIIDDIDHHDDSPAVVRSKINALSLAIIPAGASDLAIVAIQNLIHRDGIFAQLVDGRAKFLQRRVVSGPIPAIVGLVTEHQVQPDGSGRDVIVAGEATWAGQSVAACQEQIDDMGLTAFLAEVQHEVNVREGALWMPGQLARCRVADAPELERVVIAVDPSGGSTTSNDAQGIVVVGKAAGHAYVLEDATGHRSPAGWGDEAVRCWGDWDADAFVVEVNFGGDMCADTIRSALERRLGSVVSEETASLGTGQGRRIRLRFGDGRQADIRVISASRGKRARAEPVASLYGRPDDEATWSTTRVHHVGTFVELESEQTSWSPEAPWSPNRMDALVWGLTDLLLDAPVRGRRRSIARLSAA